MKALTAEEYALLRYMVSVHEPENVTPDQERLCDEFLAAGLATFVTSTAKNAHPGSGTYVPTPRGYAAIRAHAAFLASCADAYAV